MEVEAGLQPNCSETTYQICGITKDLAKAMEEMFKMRLSHKYQEEFLVKYAEDTFRVDGKYLLSLYQYEGSGEIPDWNTIVDIAKQLGYNLEDVDCCSNPISTDDAMDRHVKWRKENAN